MGRTLQQILTLIRNNITDPLLRQNTAKRQREVMEAFATDYFNKQSDSLQINQVAGLQSRLDQLGIVFQPFQIDASGIPDVAIDNQTQYNDWVLNYLRKIAGVIEVPARPTDGQVDDVADTYSVALVPGFAVLSDYQGYSPYTTGTVILTNSTGYIQNGRVYLKNVTGPAGVNDVGIGVAASGARPAGPFLTNQQPFTGTAVIVTPPPAATKASAPYFGVIDDVNNTVTLGSQYAFTEVRWGVEGQGAQALASNSVCSPGNIVGRLFAYVIADPAANRLQSDTVYSTAFSGAVGTNNAPTATISVVGGGTNFAVGQSVTLQLSGADSDAGGSVVKLELLDNGVKISGAEFAGNSGMIQSPPLTAGSHNFTARATDNGGLTGLSTAVVVTAAAASANGPTGYAAIATSSSSINVSFDAAAGATGYVLQLATNAGFTTGLQSVSQPSTTKDWEGLSAGTLYYTRAKAVFSSSESAYSTGTATTFAGATPVAATPTNFKQTNVSPDQNNLSWTVVAGTTYVLERATDAQFSQARRVLYMGPAGNFSDTGLGVSGGSYYYRVKARAANFQDSPFAYTNSVPVAYRLNGSNSFLTFANENDLALTNPAGFSVGMFLQLEGPGSVLRFGRSTSTERFFDISAEYLGEPYNSFVVGMQLQDASTNNILYRSVRPSVQYGQFFHLVVTYANNEITYYINLAPVAMDAPQGAGITALKSGGTLRAGRFATYDSVGIRIDDLFFVNRALSAAEVGSMAGANGYTKLPQETGFASAVIDTYQFENTLASWRGTHNATAVAPQYVVPVSTFTPAVPPTAAAEAFRDFNYGWLTQLGMQTWAERDYSTQVGTGNAPAPPQTFALANADSGLDALVSAAVADGVKYLGYVAHNEEGFLLYPSTVPMNIPQYTHTTPQGNQFTGPVYQQYQVVPGVADQNILGKFVSKCRAAGIEPFVYFGLSGDLNISNGECFAQGFPQERHQAIANYWAALLTEVVSKYGFKYVWTDLAGQGVTGEFIQLWYDAVKLGNPNSLLIANYLGEENAGHFPNDLQSTEESFILNGNTSYRRTARTWKGVTYTTYQEVVATPFVNARWYNVGPSGTYTPQPINVYQGLVDNAATYGANFLAGIMLNKDGSPDSRSLNYLDQINFSQLTAAPASGDQAEVTSFLPRLSAAGYNATDPVKAGMHKLIAGMKTKGVYNALPEFGLMIGGTAATHALGFKNVANTTWNGGIVHSATGAKGNGSTGYGNLNLNPSSVSGLSAVNIGLAFYSRTDVGAAGERDMGAEETTGNMAVLRMIIKLDNDDSYFEAGAAGTGYGSQPPSTAGLFVTTSNSAGSYTVYRNGTSMGTVPKANNADFLVNAPLLLLAQGNQNGTPQGYSTKECCFWALTSGLTATQVFDLNALIEEFQDTLSRGVQ